ncbi:hypothetical protein D039_1231B, partial [Vibrio parahaemolyticus EKP-028]|jgi:hypothetical protein
VNC